MKVFFSCLTVAVCLFSCNYGEVFKTYKYKDKWEIQYPPYMKKTTYVYPGAEFQSMNKYRDTYMFMRSLEVDGFSDDLLDSLSLQLQANLVDPRVKRDTSYTLNGNMFSVQYINGLLQDKKMFYITAIVENGSDRFYFSGWMFDNKRALWQVDYEKALHSWKKLK